MRTVQNINRETHSQTHLFKKGAMKPSSTLFFQPKLKIGAANDRYEKEADHVAAQVVNGQQTNVAQKSGISSLQAKFFNANIQEKKDADLMQCQEEEEEAAQPKLQKQEEEEETMQMQPLEEEEEMLQPKLQKQVEEEEEEAQPKLQRKCNCEEEEKTQLQRKSTQLANNVNVSQKLQQSRGGGSPLSKNIKAKMETGFGADFSGVKIHTDNRAVQMNKQLNARAFTTGNNIYFNKGQYNPSTTSGQLLLAHELTHTVQQGATNRNTVNRSPIVQRKKIDYQVLNWAHFKGKAKKNAKYDAMVYSGMHDPKVKKIKPKKVTYKEVEEKCGKDNKEKKVEASLEYDIKAIKVKSYFDEKKSKKKKWLTETKAQTSKCNSMFVKKCETSFKKAKKKAIKVANKEVKKCKTNKAFKKGGYLIYTLGGKEMKVSNAKECKSKYKPARIAEIISGEKWEGDNNLGTTMKAVKKEDCKKSVLETCKKTAIPQMIVALLKHEQGHFDNTQLIAEKTEIQLREKAEDLAVTAEGCGKKKANKNVKKELKKLKPKREFNKIWKAAKKKLKKTQKTYDKETNHSMKIKKQEEWNQKFKDEIVNKAKVILPKPKVVQPK